MPDGVVGAQATRAVIGWGQPIGFASGIALFVM
jgi:hypothetical protein